MRTWSLSCATGSEASPDESETTTCLTSARSAQTLPTTLSALAPTGPSRKLSPSSRSTSLTSQDDPGPSWYSSMRRGSARSRRSGISCPVGSVRGTHVQPRLPAHKSPPRSWSRPPAAPWALHPARRRAERARPARPARPPRRPRVARSLTPGRQSVPRRRSRTPMRCRCSRPRRSLPPQPTTGPSGSSTPTAPPRPSVEPPSSSVSTSRSSVEAPTFAAEWSRRGHDVVTNDARPCRS